MASGRRKSSLSKTFGTRKEGKTMADWKCQKCGYTLKEEKPPEECPSCKEKLNLRMFPAIRQIAGVPGSTTGCS
jgi:rubrerythrin